MLSRHGIVVIAVAVLSRGIASRHGVVVITVYIGVRNIRRTDPDDIHTVYAHSTIQQSLTLAALPTLPTYCYGLQGDQSHHQPLVVC